MVCMFCLANSLEHHSLYYGLLNKEQSIYKAAPQVTVVEQRKSIVWQAFKVKRQATNSVDAAEKSFTMAEDSEAFRPSRQESEEMATLMTSVA
ncbi:hypothetical protein P5673_003417, partial [Acropora cervicornis]